MITLNYDIVTQVARFASAAVIVMGGDVPVRIVFSADPGTVDGLQLALGTDATTPDVLAYTDVFVAENATTYTAVLDASDARLAAFMAAKGTTVVNAELVATLNGDRLPAPHLPVSVQKPIITGPTTGGGGPTYVLASVAGKYRFKPDGSFQLWNADQSKFHTLTLTGLAGAETLSIAAGEV